MSDVRTFQAATMQEALELVKRELGNDAVILHTRQVEKKRWLPWGKPPMFVEITAGSIVKTEARTLTRKEVGGRPRNVRTSLQDASISESARNAQERSPNSPQNGIDGGVSLEVSFSKYQGVNSTVGGIREQLARNGTLTPKTGEESRAAEPRISSPLMPQRTDGLVQGGLGTHANSRHPAAGSMPISARQASSTASAAQPQHSSPSTFRTAGQAGTNPAENSPLTAIPSPRSKGMGQRPTLPQTNPQAQRRADPTAAFVARLNNIERMLEELGRSSRIPASQDVPVELFGLYAELIDAEVEDEIARELICRLKIHCTPAQASNPVAARSVLAGLIEEEIRCVPPLRPVPGQRKVVALIGSTGVGKTTTIAKLAANFRIREKLRMGLVTVDTYRIAAVEQLRTYAEIIDLPMKVVTSPSEMRRALDDLLGLDLVLIDTAGRSPRDELQIQELKSLLSEASVDEVQLVLSVNSSAKSLESSVRKFAPVNPSSIILTKLDEASGLGGLMTVARKCRLPLRYLTTGQDVPNDIETANPRRLARLLLGQEQLGST